MFRKFGNLVLIFGGGYLIYLGIESSFFLSLGLGLLGAILFMVIVYNVSRSRTSGTLMSSVQRYSNVSQNVFRPVWFLIAFVIFGLIATASFVLSN